MQAGENTAGIKVLLRGFYVSFLGVVLVVGGVVLDIKWFAIGFTKIWGILLCLVGWKRDGLSDFVLVTIKSLLQIQRTSYGGLSPCHLFTVL